MKEEYISIETLRIWQEVEKENEELRQENRKLKRRINRSIKYIEKYKFDYEVKKKDFYMIRSLVPEFRLTEILKGQITKEQYERLMNGDSNEQINNI